MATTAEWMSGNTQANTHDSTDRLSSDARATGDGAASTGRQRLADRGTLRGKLTLTLILLWLVMIGIVASMAWQGRGNMFAERQHAMVDLVGMVETRLQAYQEQVASGDLALAEAQRRAVETIAAMHFGDQRKNYVFVVDDEHRIVSHPRRDAGTDMAGYTDPRGVAIYREMVKTGTTDGHGYIKTVSQSEASDTYRNKISYLERFAPWQWNIVAGVYVDDLQAAFYRRLGQYALVLLVAGGLITLAFVLLTRSVYRSLGGEPRDAQAALGRIADGDLASPTATRRGQPRGLMQAIERMREQLGATIAQIRQSSEAIDGGAREIAAGNNDLSARTEEQAASLEQTAASMEQLTVTVRQNADNAAQASALSGTTTTSVQHGQQVIGRVVHTMDEIRDSASEIAEIITLIDGIAFQTNLLALNAAVEAARAGEHGRGFAVVAAEVRQLAGRSADAARNIKGLIERSGAQVKTGTDLVGEAERAMSEIHDSAQRVNRLMADISAASTEQSSGIEQVNEAITQMDQVTQQNSALVEQAAAASGSLENQASALYRSVARFRIAAA